MSALAVYFDMSKLVCGAFVGDESLLMFHELPYVADGERDLRLMFNLESLFLFIIFSFKWHAL